ncbi:MAG: zinc ribbon domain-containing protein [Clostridiaceae bacterium]|jgi:ribosomal protein L40E|nr:zinc ribbon domain-containing protein [Clostridiaceae bacterium]
MSFFDKLGKRVGEAAQVAAKKSSDLVEITKLNMSISTEEDKIEKTYAKIGKEIFAKFNSNDEVDPDVIEFCKEIKTYQDNILNLKAKLMDLKNIKLCIKCEAELDKDALFCPKCGAKQEKQPDEASQSQEKERKFCSKCGAEVAEGATFCQGCGSKL